jgi:hypothetical protein
LGVKYLCKEVSDAQLNWNISLTFMVLRGQIRAVKVEMRVVVIEKSLLCRQNRVLQEWAVGKAVYMDDGWCGMTGRWKAVSLAVFHYPRGIHQVVHGKRRKSTNDSRFEV